MPEFETETPDVPPIPLARRPQDKRELLVSLGKRYVFGVFVDHELNTLELTGLVDRCTLDDRREVIVAMQVRLDYDPTLPDPFDRASYVEVAALLVDSVREATEAGRPASAMLPMVGVTDPLYLQLGGPGGKA